MDELNISIGAIRGRRPIHNFERHCANETNLQTLSITQPSYTNSSVIRELLKTGPVVKLTRLTNNEIKTALSSGKLPKVTEKSSKRCEENRDKIVQSTKKYNLRSRKNH